MLMLLVLVFDGEAGALEMIGPVRALQRQQLITVSDAATVVRRLDGKIKVKQVNSMVGAGALGGAFWGLFIGLLFWPPWLNLAGSGDAIRMVSDYGLEEDFIKEVGSAIKPGYSALFMMIATMTAEKVLAQVTDRKTIVLKTTLRSEDEARLCEAFGVGEAF